MTDDHDHGLVDEPLQSNPIWQQDNVTLHSVGIDIGSAGTQVVFSRLHLRRMGEDLTSRYVVVRRDTVFESPVHLTPYVDDERIDTAALARILDRAYQDAGHDPGEIDTGVVILTGEALRRVNAQHIAEVLSEQAGELVCATAGHHMEARLAAYGSGAALTSYQRGMRLLNIDIGGGTTKLALVDRGRVLATAALRVGGRLHVLDDTGRLVRLEPAGRYHAARCGLTWSLGHRVPETEFDRVAEAMADVVVAAVRGEPFSSRVRELFLTEPIGDYGAVDGVTFSGGVAEYVHGRETRDFADMGLRLGAALRRRVDDRAMPAPVLPGGAGIRATVLGASEYTVQLSGNTSYISDPDTLLPRRNVPVVRPDYDLGESVDALEVARAVRRHLTWFDLDDSGSDVVVALRWDGPPDYQRLRAFAQGLADGLAARVRRRGPVYLMVDGDIALTLGSLLRDECAVPGELMVLDGLRLDDFDYVDLGRLRRPSNTVPVTIKSLVFSRQAAVLAAAGG
ncbi:MAG: ethanolamine ammonia-lyase reactivating factor EutA [Nocardioidaceae bacterium]